MLTGTRTAPRRAATAPYGPRTVTARIVKNDTRRINMGGGRQMTAVRGRDPSRAAANYTAACVTRRYINCSRTEPTASPSLGKRSDRITSSAIQMSLIFPCCGISCLTHVSEKHRLKTKTRCACRFDREARGSTHPFKTLINFYRAIWAYSWFKPKKELRAVP